MRRAKRENSSKVAIVTGGSRGIGAEIVLHLLAQHMKVVVADIEVPLSELKKSAGLLFIKTDVQSESSVKKLIRETVEHFGQIDSLINNAGILPDGSSLEKTSLELWNRFLAINLTGAFLCSKYAAPYLRKKHGNIINIASTRALQSEGRDTSYAASKGGLVSLKHALAIELGPHIRVNAISPGWIDTGRWKISEKDHRQHPVGRLGLPKDIAHLVSFLISDQAGFITGQNFIADGGMTTKMIYL